MLLGFLPLIVIIVQSSGADLGGPNGPQPSLLLNKCRKCKNFQNSNKIALNSFKMLEIVFWAIQNSTFSRGACPGLDHHRRPTGLPTLRPLPSKIPGSAPDHVCVSSKKYAPDHKLRLILSGFSYFVLPL